MCWLSIFTSSPRIHSAAASRAPIDFGDRSVIGARVDHLIGLIDALGFDRLALCGSSYGALLASLIYLRDPARVSKLILNGAHRRSILRNGLLPDEQGLRRRARLDRDPNRGRVAAKADQLGLRSRADPARLGPDTCHRLRPALALHRVGPVDAELYSRRDRPRLPRSPSPRRVRYRNPGHLGPRRFRCTSGECRNRRQANAPSPA